VATDIEPVAVRNGIALDRIHIEADKHMSMSPKRIVELIVRVHISGSADGTTLLKLQRAAETCLVQRSLHPDVKCDVEIAAGPL
jgi:uncharacterized OsmC-like protein